MGLYLPNQPQEYKKLKQVDQKTRSVAILGCGWLGFPLAENLLLKNFKVSGSTTSPEKISKMVQVSIKPFIIEFKPHFEGSDPETFFRNDILIINIPPSLRKKPSGYHIAQVENLNQLILRYSVSKVIYISSTSVYPEINKKINENFKFSEPLPELVQAENILRSNKKINLTIFRCGGLMGYDRIPAKYFSGKKNLSEGGRPVNYVHRDDVIEVIYQLIEKDIWDEIFNLVAPAHPTKKAVSEKTAKDFNMALPEFNKEIQSDFKIVDAEKVINRLNYKFKYPDPLNFYYKM